MTSSFSATGPIGSGFIPSVWCECGGVCHIGATCPCQATDASSIPYRVRRLLRERYGPKCTDCGQPAASKICASCLAERL